jgi:tRNA pseudouridine13 synthase
LPNKYKIEKNIFKGLKRFGKNYQNVFESLPRSIKTLYPHSLQSYIFNKMLTSRINQFGIEVVEGDLVGKRITGYEKLKA